MKHLSFPSIGQFRNIIKSVSEQAHWMGLETKPVMSFVGTVKSHGTNAAIVWDTKENVVYAQSRSRVLSLTSDNAGFCQYFETNRKFFENYLKDMSVQNPKRYIAIYGEWCGGNIQSGVAINSLPKMFLVFAIRSADLNEDNKPVSKWIYDGIRIPENNIGCYSIEKFKTFMVEIDFNHPELAQAQLVDWTNAVEAECPIGKQFGKSGVGEGIVYHAVESNISGFILSDLLFKVKGARHSVSKVKTLAAVDVEVINSINELVATVATDNRFNQGITVLTERGIDVFDPRNTRDFIQWAREDVIKEEKDTILAAGVDFDEVMRNISSLAGKWYNSRSV